MLCFGDGAGYGPYKVLCFGDGEDTLARRCHALVMVQSVPLTPTFPSVVLSPAGNRAVLGLEPRCHPGCCTQPWLSGELGWVPGCLLAWGADVPPQQQQDTNGFGFSPLVPQFPRSGSRARGARRVPHPCGISAHWERRRALSSTAKRVRLDFEGVFGENFSFFFFFLFFSPPIFPLELA